MDQSTTYRDKTSKVGRSLCMSLFDTNLPLLNSREYLSLQLFFPSCIAPFPTGVTPLM